MAPPVGFEPTTNRLTADCSTTELRWNIQQCGSALLSRGVTPTTIGAEELNCCVRHGNRCDLFATATTSLEGMNLQNWIRNVDQRYREDLDGLVSVCCTCRHASTPDLSTSSSQRHLYKGKSHLKGGFMLRCFQHLSRPHVATQRCSWRNNWYTSGVSIPVLSY